MQRWIKIYESVRENWIWQSSRKFQWWIDMIMSAAWCDREESILNTVQTIKRGQLIASFSYLRERWAYFNDKGKKCTPSPVTINNFFVSLERAGMIKRDIQTLPNSITLITICNYDKYQQVSATNNSTHNNTTNNTINKEIIEYIDKKEDNKLSSKKESLALFETKSPKGYEKFDFSIVDESYIEAMITWLDYKRDRKEMYKNQNSFKQLYRKMLKIGSPSEVKEAVENSIANNYSGLFSTKQRKEINYGNYEQRKEKERELRRNNAAEIIKQLIAERNETGNQTIL